MAIIYLTGYEALAQDFRGHSIQPAGLEPAVFHQTVSFNTTGPGFVQLPTGTYRFLRLIADTPAHFRIATASTASGTTTQQALQAGEQLYIGVSRESLWLSAIEGVAMAGGGVVVVSGAVVVSGGGGFMTVSGGGGFITATGIITVTGFLPVAVSGAVTVTGFLPVAVSGPVTVSGAVAISGAVLISGGGGFITVTGAAGDTAHDAADAGNPVKIGGVALVTHSVANVVSGDRTNVLTDKIGRLIMISSQSRDLLGKQATTVTTTGEAVIIAATTSEFHDLIAVELTHSGTSGVQVTIRDVTTSGTSYNYWLAAAGGAVLRWSPPLQQGTATAWTATVTPATTLYVNAQFAKNI